jgi:hypothetical protein
VAKKGAKDGRIDPHWPADDDHGQHPVSELAADRQGALAPWGDLVFPLDSVPYIHPQTDINK